MRFCGMCGTRLARVCAACGFANPPHYRYCGNCGVRLAQEDEESTLLKAPAPLPSPGAEFADEPAASPELARSFGGERRTATVLVTDISGSTALLEKVGTEAWVELMNRVLHILEGEVYRFGGEVEQFRGDGMVAFFGATRAHEDDPERAVLAALAMQQAVGVYAAQVEQQRGIALRLRVGISTGEVIVSGMAERRPYEEMAMGAAIAVAARMEAAAEPGTILVSEDTYRLVESQFEWQPLGEITVRGISRPIAVYRPLTHKADSDALPRSPLVEYPTPLIGREVEFSALKRCVKDVLSGRGRIVMLTGDKGLGKSFLVNELRQYFVHRGALLSMAQAGGEAPSRPASSLTWLRGRCRSYHQGWPYSMWIDLLTDWLIQCGAHRAQSKEESRDALRRECRALWGDDEFVEHYPYIATLLSLPLEDEFNERVRHLDAEGLRRRYFIAIHSWIAAMSRRGPLALVFADMQWTDESSLDLLKYCLPLCDSEMLLMLLVFRTERDMPVWKLAQHVELEYPHRLTHIELTPLSDAQSAELIAALIGPDTLPPETRDLIVKNAAGNPYYIQELIHSLIIGGVLVCDAQADRWRVTRTVTTLDLPDNLQRLLVARIDRLSPDERFVLQVASVIGSVFWSNVVRAVIGDAPRLTRHLTALQRAQLIQETGRIPELGMQYLFRSPLVRDAAYDSLLTAQRIALHARVAEYLAFNVNPDALVGYYGLLAEQFRGAENHPKELFYTLLAAEQARKIYANAEALQRYNRAVELLDRMEAEAMDDGRRRAIAAQRFEVFKGRYEVLLAMGEIESARADARALLALADAMPDDLAWRVDALLAQPEVGVDKDVRDEVAHGLSLAQEALVLARRIGDRPRELQATIAVTRLSFFLRRPKARELAERALAMARELGDLRAEVSLLLGFSMIYGTDDLPRSEEYLQAALARSEKLNDKAIEIELLGALGARFERRGDYYRQLVECEQKRLHISREIGNRFAEGNALTFCGQIQAIYLGDDVGGLALLEEALRKWEPIASRLFPMLRIVQVHVMQGRLDEAQAMLAQAEPLSGAILNELGRVGCGLVEAVLCQAIGDEAHLRRALQATQPVLQQVANNLVSRQYRMAASCLDATTHLALARLQPAAAARVEHARQALECSQVALSLYREFGFTQVVECVGEEILFRHSQALAANGRDDEAAGFLWQAHDEMMRKHDLIPPESPFRRSYLEIPLHREIGAAVAALEKMRR
jgi:class 3 adenylate cyclase/tetratricopeptide (TPR) repeat protein